MFKSHHLKLVHVLIFSSFLLLGYQNCGKVVFESDELEKAEGGLGTLPPVTVEPLPEEIDPIDDGNNGDPDDEDPGDDQGEGGDDGDDNAGNPDDPRKELVDAYCRVRGEFRYLGNNIIRNSGFERKDGRLDLRKDIPLDEIAKRGTWGLFDSLPGRRGIRLDTWAAEGEAPIELQSSGVVIDAYKGKHLVELDSTANVSMVQDFIVCENETEYMLSFAYAPRAGADTSGVRISIGDIEVDEIYGEHKMQWKKYRYKVSNLARGIHRLRLEGVGTSDSIGALVDQVRMKRKPKPKKGVITVLLALGDAKNGEQVINPVMAKKIVRNSVRYASRMKDPKVLFVKDSNSKNESLEDTEYIYRMLSDRFFSHVDMMEEPDQGLSLEQLEGYDVVWLNNPGHAMGSQNTMLSLLAFKGGVVLSGDDMAQGKGFNNSVLTGVEYKNNGTSVGCGGASHRVDNNSANKYDVTMKRFIKNNSQLENSVDGFHFQYGNDIDHVKVIHPKAKIMATATIDIEGCGDFKIPVIIGYRDR